MIEGVQLINIKQNNYFYRLLILKRLIKEYGKLESSLQKSEDVQNIMSKQQKLMRQLQIQQKIVKSSNDQYKNRELQCNLVLNDLLQETERYITRVESDRNQYQSKIMKTWMQQINKKKQKQLQLKNQQRSNGSNNKNLMFLTSQILKKDRKAKQSSQLQQQKLQSNIKMIEQLLQRQKLLFQSQMDLLKANIIQLREKNQNIMKDYRNQIKKKEDIIIFQINQCKNNLNNAINKQKIEYQNNFREIIYLVNQIRQKSLDK